jgi:hypothetical protein
MHLLFGRDITCTEQDKTSQIPVKTAAQMWKQCLISLYATMHCPKMKQLETE